MCGRAWRREGGQAKGGGEGLAWTLQQVEREQVVGEEGRLSTPGSSFMFIEGNIYSDGFTC